MFKVGDKVVALCPYGDPYSTTCNGWVGYVVEVIDFDRSFNDIKVSNKIGDAVYGMPVNSKWFKLASKRRNLPSWW